MNHNPIIPKGIYNLGNTCFLNACIQILLQTYELDLDLQSNSISEKLETKIYQEWKSLKQQVIQSEQSVISPNSFISTIHHIAQQKNCLLFTGISQNDMPEFLLFFIENMHIFFKREVDYKINGMKQTQVDVLALQCYNMIVKRYEKDYSPLIDIFYGVMVSSIHSLGPSHSLGHSLGNPDSNIEGQVLSSISEPYFIIDLPISGNNIYDCLDQYISPELMENENAWFNEKTQQKENVYKKISFWNFPKIIVFTFKRFLTEFSKERGIQMSKKNDFIQFPLQDLDLSKYVRGYNPQKYKYDLYGICNHIGDISDGHYTAFVKNTQNDWFHCNDHIIQKVEHLEHMITPMAYSLFYRLHKS